MTTVIENADLAAIDEMIAAAKNEKKAIIKAQERDVKIDRVTNAFNEIFADRDIYYVQNDDRIFEYNRAWHDEPWCIYEPKAFKNESPLLREIDGWATLMQWLKDRGRYFQKATYTFHKADPGVLNRMRTEHWLKAVEGDVHPMYDVLMLALGGGTQAGKDHIERVLVWKYLHPADFLLPCINWYDEGGVGKNLFVDGILGALFGHDQVVSAGLDNITGSFNSLVKGRTVVMLNEASSRKVDMEKFKMLVGQPDLYINEKKIAQYRVQNTPWYLIASNDPMSIPVEGKQSDRRWSIIRLTESIEHFVASKLNCSKEEAKALWVNEFADALKEPKNLRVWLDVLMKRWSTHPAPQALHGADYDQMVALREEMNPVNNALALIEDMDTWVPVNDLYLKTIGADKFNRSTMWSDYKRFLAGIDSAIKKRRLPMIYEAGKRHHSRPTVDSGGGQDAEGAVIRYEQYSGPFTKNHWRYGSKVKKRSEERDIMALVS